MFSKKLLEIKRTLIDFPQAESYYDSAQSIVQANF